MALDPHICANITSDHFKGAQPRTQTWICRPLLSLHVLRASCWEQVWRASSETPPPPLALTTCCLKDNITPCKQAADRLQVLGQEQTRGGLSVFVRVRTRPEWRHHTCVLHACRGTEQSKAPNSGFCRYRCFANQLFNKPPTTKTQKEILHGHCCHIHLQTCRFNTVGGDEAQLSE